jgi:hypothetical protein
VVTANDDFLGQWGPRGIATGQLLDPYGIAIARNGKDLYIAEANNNRIQQFTLAAKKKRKKRKSDNQRPRIPGGCTWGPRWGACCGR